MNMTGLLKDTQEPLNGVPHDQPSKYNLTFLNK